MFSYRVAKRCLSTVAANTKTESSSFGSNVKSYESLPSLPARAWPILGHIPYLFGGGMEEPWKVLEKVRFKKNTFLLLKSWFIYKTVFKFLYIYIVYI